VAARLGSQAEATQQSLLSLEQGMRVLESGDWLGKGAAAFYQEMGSQVLPTMKRLAMALATAERTTVQISKLMAEAEAEAARWLRGEGAGQAGAAAGSGLILAGPLGSGAAGPGGGGGGSAADPGDPSLQETTNFITMTSKGLGLLGLLTGFDDTLARVYEQGIARGLADAPPEVQAAVQLALEAGAVDRKLGHFSGGARELIKHSPTLRSQIFELEQKNYNFEVSTLDEGYSTDPDTRTIYIDQPHTDAATVARIAHETAHAVLLQQRFIPATDSTTREQYVQANVDNFMHNEGEAQFNAAQVRAEVFAASGTYVGLPGTQPLEYMAIYDQFTAGTLTREQASDQMGALMGAEQVSTEDNQLYRDNYRIMFENDWDTKIAPARSR
jgi:WXG100 family type VII secretion target